MLLPRSDPGHRRLISAPGGARVRRPGSGWRRGRGRRDPPPTALHDALRRILATGEPATIPEDVLKLLNARRAEATEAGPWVEGHYRPGKRLT